MKIIHTPVDGSAPEEWPIDMNDLFVGEVKLLEKVLHHPMGTIIERAEQGYATEMFALVWIQRKRHEPQLKFSDLDTIPVSRLSIEQDVDDEDEPEDEVDDEDLTPAQKGVRTRAAKKAASPKE